MKMSKKQEMLKIAKMSKIAIIENRENTVTITKIFNSVSPAVAWVKERTHETFGGPVFAIPAETAVMIEGDDFNSVSFWAHRANSTDENPQWFKAQ